jgi:hypothetical protein
VTSEKIEELRRLEKAATPGPWRWWTSNSMRRLSSDPSGKDGDVVHAFRASDGVADIAILDRDMALIAGARNSLLRILDERDALLGSIKNLVDSIRATEAARKDSGGVFVLRPDPLVAALEKLIAQVEAP